MRRKVRTYYTAFGLTMKGISSQQSSPMLANKDKTFQGQKFDDDLGLNWVEFRYRNHDPQIGRFIEIDPLASDYVYNSTYAFSENKVTNHIELEGLESVPAWLAKSWEFTKGAGSGLWDGVKSTGSFVKSLGTTQGWKNVGNGLLDLADRGTPSGMIKNAQTFQAVENYVSNVPNMSAKEIGHDVGFGLEKAGEAVLLSKGAGAVTNAVKGAGSTTLFRAGSSLEVADAAANGVRNLSGQYSTAKLFATSAEDAAQFGKSNFALDGIPNTIMKVKVPNSVMKAARVGEMDGMKAVSIPADNLPKVKVLAPLNYSPKPTNPFGFSGW